MIDLTGEKYGRLSVLQFVGRSKTGDSKWLCQCECGNKTTVQAKNLKNGKTISCGCFRTEKLKQRRSFNVFDISGDYGIGYTSNTNKPFYFDLQDFEQIKRYCWRQGTYGYVVATIKSGKAPVKMHRYVLGLHKGDPMVDHKNRNKMDNRKENLRFATKSTNAMNRRANKDSRTGHKGVYKYGSRYHAYIKIDQKAYNLGSFSSLQEAVNARREKELELFGQFACTD